MIVGTLGVLLNAKRRGWIPSFGDCVAAMRAQGIRYHPALLRRLMHEAGETPNEPF